MEMKELETKVDELSKALETSDAKVKELEATIADMQAKAVEAKAAFDTAATEKQAMEKQIVDLTARAEKAENGLAEMQIAARDEKRLAQLSEKAKIEDREAMRAKITKLDDDAFALLLEVAAPAKAEETTTIVPAEKPAEKPQEETPNPEQTLETAKAEIEPDLQAGTEGAEDTEQETYRATACALLKRKQAE